MFLPQMSTLPCFSIDLDSVKCAFNNSKSCWPCRDWLSVHARSCVRILTSSKIRMDLVPSWRKGKLYGEITKFLDGRLLFLLGLDIVAALHFAEWLVWSLVVGCFGARNETLASLGWVQGWMGWSTKPKLRPASCSFIYFKKFNNTGAFQNGAQAIGAH